MAADRGVLERTPAQLLAGAGNVPTRVGALSVGDSRRALSLWGFDLLAGLAGTLDFLPSGLASSYGAVVQAVGRMFRAARFIKMWSLGGHGS